MTTTTAINADINAFVTSQNQNRGQSLAGGGTLALDVNALSGSVPAGDNAVTGIAGIAAGAAAITLPAGQYGNAVVIDGAISTTASTSGADSYSLLVATSGLATLTDNNTGNSETITNASYLVMDGGATTSSGTFQQNYLIETGNAALIASMYAAALMREPDYPGLEFHLQQMGTAAEPNLHTVATYILASPEFTKDWPALQTTPDDGGPNDQLFITELYGNVLHRTPDAAEIAYYVGALQGTLTTSTGAAIPAADRATLLEYFAASPENQSDISAANGGWLINPANGAVSLGSMPSSAVSTVLTSEVASGTVNASDFGNMSTSGQTVAAGAGITGANYGAGTGSQQADAEISVSTPGVTLNLSSEYFMGAIYGNNDTLNGVATGGTIALLASTLPESTYVNNVGTVNLFGNLNWVQLGNISYPVTVADVVNGWNSTDIIVGWGGGFPSYRYSAATLVANPDGFIYQGSSTNPVHGSGLSFANTNGTDGMANAIAINVGSIANDSVSAIVTASNQGYKVGDVSGEVAFFFGQDPQGNTMVWYWRGDTNHTGTVQVSDITGGVELVGIQANSLTAANFHH